MTARSALRGLPVLGPAGARLLAAARSAAWSVGRRAMPFQLAAVDLEQALPTHVPNSGVPGELLPAMMLRSAEEVPGLLNAVAEAVGLPLPRAATSTSFARDLSADPVTTERLATLLARHGSDKSTRHDYHLVYGAVLEPDRVRAVLEIGLGTADEAIPSSMGASGRPGASVRALSDLLPHAMVFGADIDDRILFQSDRITTFAVDATDDASLAALFDRLPADLDLIIDDGLHAPHANLRVLLRGLRHLRLGGWIMIEDIGEEKRAIWELVARLLPRDRYEPWLVTTRACLLFAVRRLG